MSFALECPNCGKRPVSEFRFGGEHQETPTGDISPEQWAAHLYLRRNADGPHIEWWFHRFGCRSWFMAQRDTHDNRVLATWWPEEPAPGVEVVAGHGVVGAMGQEDVTHTPLASETPGAVEIGPGD
ncbi:MAG TPA: sarcosine oxidase subunit delta [Abditibacteriaceae bacterium]|nr:sarcosine oxidase subunit delta [Abditibacteriaceae bacterium]